MKNDHQPEKLWLLNKFSSSVSQEMYREKSGEYRYWCLGLKGESDLKPSHWQPLFISSNNLTHFSFFKVHNHAAYLVDSLWESMDLLRVK